MAVSRGDLEICQGSPFQSTVYVTDAAGVPADLTPYTGARAQVRAGPADQYPVEAEITCEIVLPDQIRLTMTKEQTADISGGRYSWDLDLLPTEEVLMKGTAIVLAEVTRAEPVRVAVGR